MSIVKMSRLKIVGLKSERNKILSVLTRSGCFEVVSKGNDVEGFARQTDRSHLEKVEGYSSRLAFTIKYLQTLEPDIAEALSRNAIIREENPSYPELSFDFVAEKKSLCKKEVSFDDFNDIAAREYELLTVSENIDKISFERLEIKSKIAKLRSQIKAIEPFIEVQSPFNRVGTKTTFYLMAAGAMNESETLSDIALIKSYPSTLGVALEILAFNEKKDEIVKRLAQMGFTVSSFTYEDNASTVKARCESEIENLLARDNEYLKDAISYRKYLHDLRVLYDVEQLEHEKSTAELDFLKSRTAFIIEGWVPSQYVSRLTNEIKNKTDKFAWSSEEAKAEDNPPSLLKNPKIIQPFEDITNLYSPPGYSELDPNPIMAIFFFVFFGMMIGDAGYGLILSIGCFFILKFVKIDGGMRRMIALIGVCSISAILWGVLFGGIFGIEGIPTLWFNPIAEPILMLAVSVILGVLHISTAYVLLAIKLIRQKRYLDALFDTVFIISIFVAVGLLALSMLTKTAALQTAGIITLIASLVGIIATAGRHKKGVLSKILSGFGGLYGLVNLLSDVLSYARLFGLGLASGAIGLAFNTIGGLLFGIPIVGYVIGIIVLIPLHAFNLGLGVLGAYVHNSRLQFLEFYGKFYDGGGSLFKPMGHSLKYITVK